MGLGVLKVDLRALEGALYLPKGYHIRAVQHNSFSRLVSLLVESDAVPVAEEGHELPELIARVRVDYPEGCSPEYRKYTGSIEVREGETFTELGRG